MNFDLHLHFSLKPANSKRREGDEIPDRDHWTRRFLTPDNFNQPEIIERQYAKVVFGSQSHGQSLKDGDCRIICNSLYPIERGFIKTTFSKFVASLTGVDESILFDLDKMRLSYFQALTNEYENLLSAHRKKRFSDDGGHIVLVNSFGEILKELGKSNDSILVLNSVEGAHAFFEYSEAQRITFSEVFKAEKQLITGRKPRPNTKALEKLIDGMERNIDRVKTEWKYPPFFVTFAHHYYNHLCGHSKSLSPEIVFQQQTNIWVQDGSKIIDRTPDYVGFRPWGSKILFQLLSRKSTNGDPVRRILIDTKHMSIRARGQFLHTVKDRLQMFDDRIPIIQSHTTVNGRPSVVDTYERSGTAEDEVRTISKERSKRDDVSVLDQDPYYFDNGDLNLFDDEIRALKYLK